MTLTVKPGRAGPGEWVEESVFTTQGWAHPGHTLRELPVQQGKEYR